MRDTACPNIVPEQSEEPNLDTSSHRLVVTNRPLPSFQVIDTVISGLRNPPPGACAEYAFHGIKRWLDEVVDVPSLVDVARGGGPELHPDREPRLAFRRPDPSGEYGGPDCLFPGSLVSGSEGRRPTNDLELQHLLHG